MEHANRAASEAAYQHFNAGRQDDAVDLHGLYVKEALERARAAIRQAKAQVCAGRYARYFLDHAALRSLPIASLNWLALHVDPSSLHAPGRRPAGAQDAS